MSNSNQEQEKNSSNVSTSINSYKLNKGREDNKSNILSNNNKDEETINKLINNFEPKNNNNKTIIINKKEINNNLEEKEEKKREHSQFGIQYVMQPEIFQSMINEIKDYTATNKELVGKMVESINNYTQRIDKLIEQNGTIINLLTDLLMKKQY